MSAWWLLPLAAYIVLLHPIPAVPMFDTVYLAEKLQGMTLREALAFMARYHSSPRPIRTLELWLAAKGWGTSAWGYGIANLTAGCGVVVASALVASRLIGSSSRGVAVGALMALSYPMMYALLHFPFGLNVAIGLAGLAIALRSWWGMLLTVLGGLGHEVIFALIPVAVMWRVVRASCLTTRSAS